MTKRRLLLIASTGGHLSQLKRLSKRLNAGSDSLWVTFDSPQSRSLLANDDVFFVPYVSPRDWRGVLRAAKLIRHRLRGEEFDEAVSTGAALALAGLPMARLAGIPSTYIESVSRLNGPSLTGRILAAMRFVSLQTQHAAWAKGKWSHIDSVLSEYEARPSRPVPETANLQVFVTLGTIKPYRFDRLVDAVLAIGLEPSQIHWQLGETSRDDIDENAHVLISGEEFARRVDAADVVVTHAGVGTIIALLERGIFPVVVPRSAGAGEHVDDHQHQAAALVDRLGVGVSRLPSELVLSDLLEASTRSVTTKVRDEQ